MENLNLCPRDIIDNLQGRTMWQLQIKKVV